MARPTTSPRVQAHADLNGNPAPPKHVLGIAFHRFLHPQGRVASAHGVIFVGEWSAEEGHDPIAHHLVHGALVAVHGLHHVFQHRIEELAPLLEIVVGQKLHRPLEVGEKDRHLLALAFQRRLGCEDLLGQVLGGVRVGAGDLRLRIGSEWGRAVTAESVAEGIDGATGGASSRERRGALSAEPHARRVLMLTPGTPHPRSP
jgi:hypothetical protein